MIYFKLNLTSWQDTRTSFETQSQQRLCRYKGANVEELDIAAGIIIQIAERVGTSRQIDHDCL